MEIPKIQAAPHSNEPDFSVVPPKLQCHCGKEYGKCRHSIESGIKPSLADLVMKDNPPERQEGVIYKLSGISSLLFFAGGVIVGALING